LINIKQLTSNSISCSLVDLQLVLLTISNVSSYDEAQNKLLLK